MNPSAHKILSPPMPTPDISAPPITPDELIRSLPAGTKILDIGCGSGSFDYSARTDIDIHCCDILPPSPVPDLANVHYRHVSADALDYPPESFDLLLMNFVLEHTRQPSHIIELAHDILKQDGILYISVPISSHFEDRSFRAYDRFLKILTLRPFDPVEHVQHFSEEKLLSLAIEAGFTPVARALVPAGFGWIYGNIDTLSVSPGMKNRAKLLICRWNLLVAGIWLNINRLLTARDPRRWANILCTFRKSSSQADSIPSRSFTHSCGHCGLPISIENSDSERKSGVTRWKCPRCGNLNIL